MSHRLDELIRALRAEGSDRDLGQLEPAVWRRLEAVRGGRGPVRSVVLPLRTAAVLMSLVVGVAIGGASAATAASQRTETSVFALDTRLAPSTLLGGRR
jgi:hypothetical protein